MNIANNLVTFKRNGWAVPAGWKLVPEEPTEEMLAATSWPGCAKTDYRHMLRAAPQPPRAQPLTDEQIYGLYRRAGLNAYHLRDDLRMRTYDKCINNFARAIEQAHGIGVKDD